MNILLINHTHFYRGGAHTVYFKTAELLGKHGHKVIFFSMHHPDNLPSEFSEYFMPHIDWNVHHSHISKVKTAGTLLYSFEARKRLSMLLDKYPVDLVHMHNIYHTLSPSILHTLKKRGIPTVMTLHNYKLVCGSYLLYLRDPVKGRTCEDCGGGRFYMSVRNKCVKDSYFKSMLTAAEMYLHHKILHIYENIDMFIATSMFIKNKLNEMGFKRDTVFLPNFFDISEYMEIESSLESSRKSGQKYVIYVGRLAPEKGLWTLLDAAKRFSDSGIVLKLSGSGPMKEPLMDKVRREGITNVEFLGYIKYRDLCREIMNSIAMVLPTECYENNPLSVIEAFAFGKPVIGARIGGIPELVRNEETGLTFEPGDPDGLSERIMYLTGHPEKAEKWGRNAKAFVENELDSEKHYRKLMEIYDMAIKKRS